MRTILLALVLITLATPALATDGVLEINQTCAVQTGCFSGDTAGYPVTIDGRAGRSYRLTSDLTGIGANSDGIFLNISRITLDFNGFSLAGFSIGSGTGHGITGGGVGGAVAGFATIKNGVIRGFRALGVALGGANGVRIENMTFEFNRGGGVQVGDDGRILKNGFSGNGGVTNTNDGLSAGVGALIVENVVSGSGGNGISANRGSTVSGNTAYQNGDNGITTGSGSTISGNTTYANAANGINANTGSTVSGNTAYQNVNHGLHAGQGSIISGNAAYQNANDGINGGFSVTIIGNSVSLNGDTFSTPVFDDGIECGAGCLVSGNSVRSTYGYGLNLLDGSSYRENVVDNNNWGSVRGTGIDAGANVINGAVTPTP